ncbi:MipA/OmpV family protein [Vibrio tapetis]|uniref:Putative MltA-interacting MipA n=2 Tax=Vibrio tapetis TaxID=52443 RepID=A0A2N8ZA47_9VIBR|nr:MipA/OmpV family protein [Vibrio tapetis]AIY26164.1 putative MltA-interacting MipA [Vibrio tapetis]SON48789.1 putative MltA-interacting MipA [Vibrio tapetis subsp. tapetis]
MLFNKQLLEQPLLSKPIITLCAISALSSSFAFAQSEQEWGLSAAYRSASLVHDFPGTSDTSVSTFVPMFYYQGERFYMDGLEGGAHLYQQDDWQVNAFTRLRFVDLPASKQNEFGGDVFDLGMQYRHNMDEFWYTDVEVLSDSHGRFHGNVKATAEYLTESWDFKPSIQMRYKTADFNSQYYAAESLTGERIGGGVDFKMGFEARYHVTSNLYLMGSAFATRLDGAAYGASTVNEQWASEYFVGFGFSNDNSVPRKSEIGAKPYMRIAQGFATPSDMGDIFQGKGESDPNNNKMTSFFYGHPLTDELFGLPLDVYLTPGVAWHWQSDTQKSSPEYVVAIKAYYTFDWPVRWKFGVAEGVSYVQHPTYIESSELEKKEYANGSPLMNYLDISFDINVGDIVGKSDWENMWIGYSLHHRSSIFEKASQFGRIKGGSNYNTVYLQYDF